jgi:hypothetical protein
MVYQVVYEYSAGNSISMYSNDLTVKYARPKMRIDTMVDGTIKVTDPGNSQRTFMFSTVLNGDTMDTLDSVQTGSITYTGAYPRNQKVYWDSDSTESNVEVAITDMTAKDLGSGWWLVTITMVEKDQ